MSKRMTEIRLKVSSVLLMVMVLIAASGCHSTRYLKDNQYLVRKNRIILKSDKVITNRGEMKDNLAHLAAQKPNSYFLGIFPFKLALYNRRYEKLHRNQDTVLPKSVQRPVILDTALLTKSMQNMKAYMFNQGYFYARVQDTVILHKKKAYVNYIINAGSNYLINRVNYSFDDSAIAEVIRKEAKGTVLKKGIEFTYSLLEEERSRIAAVAGNNGYRRFGLDNITFLIDTVDKSMFRVAASPFENAVNFISQVKSNKKTTIDIDIIVRMADDTLAYNKYKLGKVTIYPDYKSVADRTDTSLTLKKDGKLVFKYHDDYVHAHVLHEHIFLSPGSTFSKADEDKTVTKLGELGIFQYIRVQYRPDRSLKNTLDCDIYLNRAKRHDFSTNYEVSSGSTYALGNSIGLNYANKNFMKGANLLNVSVNGGIEYLYNANSDKDVINRFSISTKYYGINGNLDFPKFLAPIASSLFSNSNLPHTIIGGGENVIDRLDYYRLINSSANFSYSWHQTQTTTWGLSPAFVNIIKVPRISPTFDTILQQNAYLRNSYKENFIEGENISFKFDNNVKKRGLNYSYLRLAIEEAGGILDAVNTLGDALKSIYEIQFAQYTKFDFDARHYFTFPKSVFAFRLWGGVGIPYGNSTTLPYIKQYFAGGPYSLRGWRIRTLGPGSYFDYTNTNANANLVDRTADVKIEFNGEYRFPVAPLFAGALKMNGAIFADAGNIWLAKKDPNYPGGELQLSTLGHDIAVDIGTGTRFDIASFLTVRVDVAMPIKKPYVFSNGGWVINDLFFYDSGWRANNLVLNVTIGYPF